MDFSLFLLSDAVLNECHSVPYVSQSISRDSRVSIKWPWKEKTTGQSCMSENSHLGKMEALKSNDALF